MDVIRFWGSTESERSERFACDRWVPDAELALFRAVDIAASPTVVFRWLCQLRAAPYSYDLIDNWGRTSPRELTPGLDALATGQRVMTIFELVEYERDRHLTIVLDRGVRIFGKIAVTYRISPSATGTRLVVKLVGRRPHGVARLFAPLLPAGDFVMMRKQLLTLKQLAER